MTLVLPRFLRAGIAAGWCALLLAGCGGGSGDAPAAQVPSTQRLVGEIFATPADLATAELQTNAGYAGNVATSGAIQAAGKQSLLDMLFIFYGAGTQGRNHDKVADDAEQNLLRYIANNRALLVPGVRVLILDEIYWNPPDARDTNAVLEPQLQALKAGVALVRKHLPQARIGITVTPYAAMDRPNTLAYIQRAIALVDWVGTDPYWLGDPATIPSLHQWSRSFHTLAKAAHPAVETWFIAQAFKFQNWDTAVFNAFIAEQLGYADQYDHVLFFGWQHTSELDPASAGKFFAPATKDLYRKYLQAAAR